MQREAVGEERRKAKLGSVQEDLRESKKRGFSSHRKTRFSERTITEDRKERGRWLQRHRVGYTAEEINHLFTLLFSAYKRIETPSHCLSLQPHYQNRSNYHRTPTITNPQHQFSRNYPTHTIPILAPPPTSYRNLTLSQPNSKHTPLTAPKDPRTLPSISQPIFQNQELLKVIHY